MKYIILSDTTPSSQSYGLGDTLSTRLSTKGKSRKEFKIEEGDLSEDQASDAARDPKVRYLAPAMPMRLIRPKSTGAAGETDIWGLGAVGVNASKRTGAGVQVAVLDTGIDRNHPAFSHVKVVPENFTNGAAEDTDGHGTHCAGIIFGGEVEGERIGVAPGIARALIGKVIDDDGAGSTEMLFRGLHWAMKEGAHVISMSLGFDYPGMQRRLVGKGWPEDIATSMALDAFAKNLRLFDTLAEEAALGPSGGSGAIIVAASGNESRADENALYRISASLPAAAKDIISVGALQRAATAGRYAIAPFSNSLPFVCAPGVDIVSAKLDGGLTAMSGTSMACPHVAGIAALHWEEVLADNPGAFPMQTVRAKLIGSARTALIDGTAADRGAGLVQAPQ